MTAFQADAFQNELTHLTKGFQVGEEPPAPPVLVNSVSAGNIRQLWPPEFVDSDDEAVLVMLALVDQWL